MLLLLLSDDLISNTYYKNVSTIIYVKCSGFYKNSQFLDQVLSIIFTGAVNMRRCRNWTCVRELVGCICSELEL